MHRCEVECRGGGECDSCEHARDDCCTDVVQEMTDVVQKMTDVLMWYRTCTDVVQEMTDVLTWYRR